MKSYVNKMLGSSNLLEPITLGGAALIAGGTALANWLFNKEQGSFNVGRSKELMDYQMNKQQQYQKWLSAMQFPSMIASLRSAGLNPNLALGGTPSQPMASASSASYNQNPSQVDLSTLSAISAMSLNKSQEKVNEEQARMYGEQANLYREEAQNKSFYNDTFFDNYAYEKAEQVSRTLNNRASFDQAYQNIKNLQKGVDLLDEQINNAKKEGRLTEEYIKVVLPKAKAEIAEMFSRVKLNKKYMDEIDQSIEESGARVTKLGQEVKLTGLMVRLTRVQAEVMEEYGADSMQAQIVGQYINAIASFLGAGAQSISAAKGGKGTTIINKMPPSPQY